MNTISEHHLDCPFCGEQISVLIDGSVPEQEYVEDCQVCCRPLVLTVSMDAAGEFAVAARNENET